MRHSHSLRWLTAAILMVFTISAASAQPFDFGDDNGQWPNDGECDDTRFEGPGMSDEEFWFDENIGHDASDCSDLFSQGDLRYVGPIEGSDQPIMSGNVDFGDNTSLFANDGECDDPRFVGEFMAIELMAEDRGHDAADCQTLYDQGLIQLKPAPSQAVNTINFGDDTSQWNNDGECDDPRFDGPGSAVNLVDENLGRDATDCRELFLSGEVEYLGDDPSMDQVSYDGIDFGNNTSVWSNDGECDDPRFAGNGMAEETSGANLGHDANDCQSLYESGDVRLIGSPTLAHNDPNASGIDFGDDDGEWPGDGECDDPRFEGPGMALAEYLDDANTGHDATDCRMHYVTGQVTLIGGASNGGHSTAGIDFGDDSGPWPSDGECDDMRFSGPGMAAEEYLDEANIGHDASDCRSLYTSGDVTFNGQSGGMGNNGSGIDFGDDDGYWPNDGECDDMRFDGPGMAVIESLDEANVGHDATDCRTLLDSGDVYYTGDFSSSGGMDTGDIDFGNDGGTWPNDGECDDMRFAGPGMSDPQFHTEDNVAGDATDCRELFEAGMVHLATSQGEEYNGLFDGIDFGDDDGGWPRDGECDDPRFEGPGMAIADSLDEANEGHDATDCMDLYQAGDVQLMGGTLPPTTPMFDAGDVDFGDDRGDWPNDGECDDMRFVGEGMAAPATLTENNIGHDATDCQVHYEAGRITMANGEAPNLNDSGIDFGDDNGAWPDDGECDDPRFEGPGMAFDDTLSDSNIGHDATDCRYLFNTGAITLM